MKNIRSHTVFFVLALAGIMVLTAFAYYTYRPITIGPYPKENIEKFNQHKNYLTIGNFIVYFILLFVANIMYIRRRYWDTFIWAGLIFATYAIIDWWWLGEKLFQYKEANDLGFGESKLGPFVGVMIALFGLALAIGNYLLLKRLVKEKNIKPIEQDLKGEKHLQD